MSGPNYTYSPNVPQGPQTRASTQTPILNNYQAIPELLEVNHIGFNDPVNYGKHKFTSFPIQVSDPSTTSTEMALYSKATSGNNPAEIFYRYPSNGVVKQLTGGTSTGGAAENGYSYLPGGLLMKWGKATGITTPSTTVVFPTSGGIPAFSSSVSFVQFTPASNYTQNINGAYITNITTLDFKINVPSTISSTIYWFAIGI